MASNSQPTSHKLATNYQCDQQAWQHANPSDATTVPRPARGQTNLEVHTLASHTKQHMVLIDWGCRHAEFRLRTDHCPTNPLTDLLAI
jgi:hypothetical protein